MMVVVSDLLILLPVGIPVVAYRLLGVIHPLFTLIVADGFVRMQVWSVPFGLLCRVSGAAVAQSPCVAIHFVQGYESTSFRCSEYPAAYFRCRVFRCRVFF